MGAACFELVLKAFGEGQGERTGLSVVLACCAAISLAGAAVTHYYVHDLRGKDLDADRGGVELLDATGAFATGDEDSESSLST